MNKPYLTSIGIAYMNLHAHRYLDTRKKYKLRTWRLFGIVIIRISYTKVAND